MDSVFLLAASMVVIVIGMILYVTGITMDVNKVTPRGKIDLAMGLLTALPYVSNFISP